MAQTVSTRPASFLGDSAEDQPLSSVDDKSSADSMSVLSHDTLPVAVGFPQWTARAPRAPLGLRPGQRLGDYEIVAPIGRGGMGLVYEAVDVNLHRTVAIKVLRSQRKEGSSSTQLLAEARAAVHLKHPRFVTVHHIGQAVLTDDEAPVPYMVMERLQGQPMREFFARSEPFSTVARIFEQLLEGLAHAHEQGLVHHDLKPDNVFVCTDNQVKILDLGLAGLEASARAQSLSALGVAVLSAQRAGTEPYMAPETWSGGTPTRAIDVWAVGLMFYQALAGGRHPFWDAKLPREANLLRLADPRYLIPLQSLRPDIPPGFDELLEETLRKQPTERIQSATELLERLRQLLAASEPQAARSPRGSVPRRWPGNGRYLTLGLASVLLLGTAAAVRYTGRVAGMAPAHSFSMQPVSAAPHQVLADKPASAPSTSLREPVKPPEVRPAPPQQQPAGKRAAKPAGRPLYMRRLTEPPAVSQSTAQPVTALQPSPGPEAPSAPAAAPSPVAEVQGERVRRYVLP